MLGTARHNGGSGFNKKFEFEIKYLSQQDTM
jgi:hypothetical protein